MDQQTCDAAERHCHEQRRHDPDFDIVDYFFRHCRHWIRLIKTLRASYGVDIYGAQELALRHEGWQRWARLGILKDQQCRKEALTHLKYHPRDALIDLRDDDVEFLTPRRFDITLLIRHPTIDPVEITDHLGLAPYANQQVGQPRVTPIGTKLDGLYWESRWSHRSRHRVTGQWFVPEVTDFVTKLLPHADYLRQLREGARDCSLSISFLDVAHYGDTLPTDLLRQLADLGLDLGIQLFGVRQN